MLVEDQKLDAVVKLPGRRIQAVCRCVDRDPALHQDQFGRHGQRVVLRRRRGGWSLDDKRNPVEANDLPEVLRRWAERTTTELKQTRIEQSFCVSKDDIVAQGYDLSLNRYKETVQDNVEHRPPLEIIQDIENLECQIGAVLAELKGMLS